MANTYAYSGPGTRWAVEDPTAEDYLNVSRINCDHLHEALSQIMDTDAADGVDTIAPDTDSLRNLGSATKRFLKLFADAIGDSAAQLSIDASSIIAPNNPAFLAFNSADDSNVTGDATTATVDFDSEVFDNGSDFAADTFTAPVAGKYRLEFSVALGGLDADTYERMMVTIVTSNRTYYFGQQSATIYETQSATKTLSASGSVLADMDASDTATVQAKVWGGTKSVEIRGDVSALVTFFSGSLAVA